MTHRAKSTGEYWAWQDDEENHLESLTCPILIRPKSLRVLLAAKAPAARLTVDIKAACQLAASEFFDDFRERNGDMGRVMSYESLAWLFERHINAALDDKAGKGCVG